MVIKENISLKKYNTFGVDVKANYFAEITSENQIEKIVSSDIDLKNRFILGGGSNVLFINNFDGIIIKNSIQGIKKINEDENEVTIEIGAGVIWQKFVEYCLRNNFWGIENLTLIPGTVGAAPIQNIGAYGQELKDVFYSLNGFDLTDNVKRTYNNDQCKFGYRDSIFKNEAKNRIFITTVTLKLSKKINPILSYQPVKELVEKRNLVFPTISQISEIITEIRRSKLPDPNIVGNAGSFFKNPEVSNEVFKELKKDYPEMKGFKTSNSKIKISAGWLIEKCGWKGKRIGNVGSFEKQALVLVNYGDASGKDVIEFAQNVKDSVKSNFNIELVEEINIV